MTTATAANARELLRLRGLRKAFGGVRAVEGVDLTLSEGEVLGLVGENGAGKSTVVRMLSGVVQPDAGEVRLGGETVVFGGARDARAAGIAAIHQELALIDTFSVAENVFLGEPYPRSGGRIDWGQMRREARAAFENFGHEVDVSRPLASVSTWERWLTEVVRGLRTDSRVLVLDEPTAAMDLEDVEKLFAAVRHAAAAGTGVIFVSHRIGELLEVCDRIHVMRDGRSVADRPVAGLEAAELVRLIAGTPAEAAAAPMPALDRIGAPLLEARAIGAGRQLRDVSLSAAAGEIVGVAGLVGSGRSTLLRALAGAQPIEAGELHLGGERLRLRSPRQAARKGIAMLAEDRLADGLVAGLSVGANISLGHTQGPASAAGLIRRAAEEQLAREWIERLSIRSATPAGPVLALSGGNQQKVLLARALQRQPRLLVLDEPTRGVDVGARAELHELVRSFAAGGGTVVLATSDLDELCELVDRTIVLREGRLVAELRADLLNRDQILRCCYDHA